MQQQIVYNKHKCQTIHIIRGRAPIWNKKEHKFVNKTNIFWSANKLYNHCITKLYNHCINKYTININKLYNHYCIKNIQSIY